MITIYPTAEVKDEIGNHWLSVADGNTRPAMLPRLLYWMDMGNISTMIGTP